MQRFRKPGRCAPLPVDVHHFKNMPLVRREGVQRAFNASHGQLCYLKPELQLVRRTMSRSRRSFSPFPPGSFSGFDTRGEVSARSTRRISSGSAVTAARLYLCTRSTSRVCWRVVTVDTPPFRRSEKAAAFLASSGFCFRFASGLLRFCSHIRPYTNASECQRMLAFAICRRHPAPPEGIYLSADCCQTSASCQLISE